VDDAIVVVENVERVMHEDHLGPVEATRKAMSQITGALIGVAMVLMVVFIPMAFFAGSTGVIYRQFSITIVTAMVLSVIVAMILTPALCATLLKPLPVDFAPASTGFFGAFNRTFTSITNWYQNAVSSIFQRVIRFLMIFAGILLALGFMFARLPTAFLPNEDMGSLFALISMPPGSTQERTSGVLSQVEDYFLTEEKEVTQSIFTLSGYSFSGVGQNNGLAFINLVPWEEREKLRYVYLRSSAVLSKIIDGTVFAFPPPSVPELGTADGFDMHLVNEAGLTHDQLIDARNQILQIANTDPKYKDKLVAVRPTGQNDSPAFQIKIDEEKAFALGVNLTEAYQALALAWSPVYLNDFLDRGRTKPVRIQAQASDRMLPEDIMKWQIRNNKGNMVPFSAFSSTEWNSASPLLERFNGLPSININGNAAPGASSGEAMDAMEEIVAGIPGISLAWQGISYEERAAGGQSTQLYILSLIAVFLCLAALYESWTIPTAVLLVVPLGIIGAVLFATVIHAPNDVYFQVALLTTVGLVSKNAILIVEFAKALYDEGRSPIEAATEAAKQRLRPIVMTSGAFMLGVVPLMLSSGAGANGQKEVGFAVFGGMLSATVLALFFVPLFFVLVMPKKRKEPIDTTHHNHAVSDTVSHTKDTHNA
jgi:hydrophobe/amphiphile efflux-1 (HAE1) family protein